MGRLLFDTDVLIDYLRGNELARDYINGVDAYVYISVITVAELYAGVRKGRERNELEEFIETFEIVSLEKVIAIKAGQYRNKFGPSHGTGLADALIAASANAVGAQLITMNIKHFPMLENAIKPYDKH